MTRTRRCVPLLLVLSLMLPAWGCEGPGPLTSSVAPAGTGRVLWFEDFIGPAGSLPQSSHWAFDVGTDWGNAQLEYDTARPSNVSLDGQGNLAITARRESFQGSAYTSGRINTRGLFSRSQGRFEARMKLPSGRGWKCSQ